MPVPEVTSETAEFWAATAEGTLLLPRCDAVRHRDLVPARVLSRLRELRRHMVPGERPRDRLQLHRRPASRAAVRPIRTVRRRVRGARGGTRVLTNVVECEPDEVEIGMPVEVVFHDTGEGRALYRFRPSGS